MSNLTKREEVWLRAYCVAMDEYQETDAATAADVALAAFDERFPATTEDCDVTNFMCAKPSREPSRGEAILQALKEAHRKSN